MVAYNFLFQKETLRIVGNSKRFFFTFSVVATTTAKSSMAPEPLQQWSSDDVVTWLCAIGLGSKADAFKDNAVDGSLLSSLTKEDLTSDLGLSGLQAKKVLLEMDFINGLTSGEGGGGADPEEMNRLQEELQAKDATIAQLRAELDALTVKSVPAPAPAPVHYAPAPAPRAAPPPYRNEHHVVKGAAGGAAKGAVTGAVSKYSQFPNIYLGFCFNQANISLFILFYKISWSHCWRSCSRS